MYLLCWLLQKIYEDDVSGPYAYSGSDWNSPDYDRCAEIAYDGTIF